MVQYESVNTEGAHVPDASQSVSFVGFPLLLGAIFSDNKDDYSCNLLKLTTRLGHLSMIYRERTKALQEHYLSDPSEACAWAYGDATRQYFSDITQASPSLFTADASSFKDAVLQLTALQEMIERDDCPVIY